jgi:hypothetical protein
MRGMTKSAARVAHEALAVGRRTFPTYGSRTSRHDFTQAQLFALLVLRQFLRTDYRGLVTFGRVAGVKKGFGAPGGAALLHPCLCSAPPLAGG